MLETLKNFDTSGQGEMLVTFPEASGCRNVRVEMSKLRQAQFDITPLANYK